MEINSALVIKKNDTDSSVITTMDQKGIVDMTQNFEQLVRNDFWVDDSSNLLISSSHAPLIIEYIAILTNCVQDPSLITEEMPREEFFKLKFPSSFKCCIYQVVTQATKAYKVGNSSMFSIQNWLVDVPDHLINILKIMNEPHSSESVRRTINRLLKKVEKSADNCKKLAQNAFQSYSAVSEILEELCDATMKYTAFSEKEKRKNIQRKSFLENDRSTVEDMKNKFKKDFENTEKNLNDARKMNKKQLHSNDVLIKILTLEAIDATKDIAQSIISPEAKALSFGSNVLQIGFEKVMEQIENKKSATNNRTLAKQNDLIEAVEKIANSLNYNTDHETACGYATSLKAFENVTFGTSEGIQLSRDANRCRLFLKQNSENLSTEENKKQIENFKASLMNDVTACIKAMEKKEAQQLQQKAANISLREQFVIADNEKTRVISEQLKNESEIAEKRRNELKEKSEELRKIIKELQMIDITNADLTDNMKCLKNALGFIANARTSWGRLVDFFDKIKTIIEINLSENIMDFTEEAKEDNEFSQALMIEDFFKSAAYCIQITNCAKIYSSASRECIMPVIEETHNYFYLTPGEVKQKQSEFEIKKEEIEKNVRKVVEEMTEAYDESVEQQIKALINKLASPIMPSTTHREILN